MNEEVNVLPQYLEQYRSRNGYIIKLRQLKLLRLGFSTKRNIKNKQTKIKSESFIMCMGSYVNADSRAINRIHINIKNTLKVNTQTSNEQKNKNEECSI